MSVERLEIEPEPQAGEREALEQALVELRAPPSHPADESAWRRSGLDVDDR